MELLSDLIIGSVVGGALGSKTGGVVGALLQKDGSFKGAVAGGLIGSFFEDHDEETVDGEIEPFGLPNEGDDLFF
jgi:outer membrane lipoprotein SlyB